LVSKLKSRDYDLTAILLIFGIFAGLGIRVFLIGFHPLDHDELLQFEAIKNLSGTSLIDHLIKEDTQMPLSYWVSELSFWIFGKSLIGLRLPSLILSLCCYPMLYLIFKTKGRAFHLELASEKALSLSDGKMKTLSCGNCLDYYLDGRGTCFGRKID
jgi:4-amino-4-deoxy-L-arabinose transferase-like glycosyltransferase